MTRANLGPATVEAIPSCRSRTCRYPPPRGLPAPPTTGPWGVATESRSSSFPTCFQTRSPRRHGSRRGSGLPGDTARSAAALTRITRVTNTCPTGVRIAEATSRLRPGPYWRDRSSRSASGPSQSTCTWSTSAAAAKAPGGAPAGERPPQASVSAPSSLLPDGRRQGDEWWNGRKAAQVQGLDTMTDGEMVAQIGDAAIERKRCLDKTRAEELAGFLRKHNAL